MHQSEIYDNVPVKVKAELFQFSVNDFEADMKLHSLMLKELNVRMYSSELYDDYMSVVNCPLCQGHFELV